MGKRHSNYGALLNSLSQVMTRLGRYDEAEALQMESLAIKKETVGQGHPDYGISLINLAQLVARRDPAGAGGAGHL